MKKFVLILVALITLIGIPVTVFLSMRSQELRKRAAPATNLSLTPASLTKKVGDEFTVEAKINTADNQVVATQISLTYDPTKLEAISITNGTLFPNILASGVVGNGTASIAVGAANTTTPVHGVGTAAVAKFKALAATTSPITIRFSQDTFVGALGEGSTNVLVGSTPATITILAEGTAASTVTPSVRPSTTLTLTPTPTTSTSAPAVITFGGTQGFTYAPATTSVKVGQPVVWRGDFVTHPLESADSLWPKVQTGNEFTHTFTTPGTYTYYCTAHGNATSGMKGQITVTADTTQTDTSTATDSATLQILTPIGNEIVASDMPTFTGTAPPGAVVTIVIHSESEITATVVADENGDWSYTAEEPLAPGAHTIIVAAQDPTTGETTTATIAFAVDTEGSLATDTTGSALPVSGTVETTIAFLLIGVLFIVGGFATPYLLKTKS